MQKKKKKLIKLLTLLVQIMNLLSKEYMIN